MSTRVIEKFIDATSGKQRTSLTYTGKLNFDLRPDKEWGSISIEKPVWKARAERHLIVPTLWTAPDYSPHVSAFTKEEVQKLSQDFLKEYQDKEIKFNFTDTCRIVDPDGWDEVYELAFEPVDCLYLEHLRMKLGFTPKMYGKHEFHVTLGLKLVKDKQKHENKKI